MQDEREVCGTCRYCKLESKDSGFICTNPDSDNIADWVEYKDFCYEWEQKEDKA